MTSQLEQIIKQKVIIMQWANPYFHQLNIMSDNALVPVKSRYNITHLSDYISTTIFHVCQSFLKETEKTKDVYAEEAFT